MIENAIAAATEAIRLEQEGKDALAIQKYAEAADWLLIVIKGESDEKRRAGLAKRAEEYVLSAERLKVKKPKKKKAPPAAAGPRPQQRQLSYFTADESFRSDVSRARKLVAEAKKPFVDADFGESDWVRASALGWGDDPFAGTLATPADVDQGILGDCWLLSSLSVLAGYPELVRRLLVASSDGIHATRFCYAGEWRLVLIDDRIPCDERGTPKFAARAENGSYWVPILEKGLAKLFGGYEALDEGTAAEALGLLTGLPTQTLSTSQDAQFFDQLARAQSAGFIVAASCGHTKRRSVEEYEKFGLKHAHEYALLKVVQVRGVRLLQLRNPWGSGEWRGRWSRGSAEWNNIALSEEDKTHVKTDDGVFFMQLEDFLEFFHEIAICRLRHNFVQTRYDVHVKPGLSSPAPAFLVTGGNSLVDVCLLQATERGKVPKGHHVMADISLAVYTKRWEIVAMTRRGMLAPIVDAPFNLHDGQEFIVVPICINWRVLNLTGALKAVFYSSKPIRVKQIDLDPNRLALALRAAVLAKGERAGKEKNDALVYDLEGMHLAENRSTSKSLSITIALGKSSHLISSRHGGVLDEKKPAGAYRVTDVIPPLSFQLTLFRVPFRPSWSIQGTTLEWSFVHPSSTEQEAHDPPIPGLASNNKSLHSPFPIGSLPQEGGV